MKKVNVLTEWAPLKEVIVGSVFNQSSHNVDLSFKVFFNDNVKDVFLKNSIKLQQKLIEERQVDLDNLASLLSKLGISVHRPEKLEVISEFKTPYFQDFTSPCDNPRDQVLILGDKIIETPCIWRKRYFENDQLKHIFYPFFENGSPWISAPRPMMKDSSYDISRMKDNINITQSEKDQQGGLKEIMFDAAQCIKFGRDILININSKNHELGLKWLKSIVGNDFRFHPITLCDHHIDGMLMPIAPGRLLINSGTMPSQLDKLPSFLKDWEIIRVDVEHKASYEFNLSSVNIYANVLPISPNKIIIFNEGETPDRVLTSILDKHKIDYIHTQLRHSRLFGGGAHCATLDLIRDEKLEDYS